MIRLGGDLRTTVAGEELVLTAEKTAYWPGEKTLFVADLHLGKAAAFRAAAVPVPAGITVDDLARLGRAVERTGATRLVVLGDFFHARAGCVEHVLTEIGEWRERHSSVEILLVRGNHDRRAGDPPAAWNIDCVDAPFPRPPWAFSHYPDACDDGYVLSGHVHPMATLRGRGRQRLRLSCFCFGERVGILPAFGSFTGCAWQPPPEDAAVYVVADDAVLKVTQ